MKCLSMKCLSMKCLSMKCLSMKCPKGKLAMALVCQHKTDNNKTMQPNIKQYQELNYFLENQIN